jgi:hypothetical protein
MAFPGSKEGELLSARLPKLSRQQRAAFAAACAERLLPLYHYFFRKPQRCIEAIDLAWRFAMGETLNEADMRAVDDACEALVDRLYEKDDTDYPLYTVKSMIGALHSVNSTTANAAEEAAFNAQDAAKRADFEHRNSPDPPMLEEALWQLKALDVAASADRITRDLFSQLPSNPKWLQEFRRKNKIAP